MKRHFQSFKLKLLLKNSNFKACIETALQKTSRLSSFALRPNVAVVCSDETKGVVKCYDCQNSDIFAMAISNWLPYCAVATSLGIVS